MQMDSAPPIFSDPSETTRVGRLEKLRNLLKVDISEYDFEKRRERNMQPASHAVFSACIYHCLLLMTMDFLLNKDYKMPILARNIKFDLGRICQGDKTFMRSDIKIPLNFK
jgi:hypothetical protein